MSKQIRFGLFFTYILCMFAFIGNTSTSLEVKNINQSQSNFNQSINFKNYQFTYSPSSKTPHSLVKELNNTDKEEEDEENEAKKNQRNSAQLNYTTLSYSFNQFSLSYINKSVNITSKHPIYIILENFRL